MSMNKHSQQTDLECIHGCKRLIGFYWIEWVLPYTAKDGARMLKIRISDISARLTVYWFVDGPETGLQPGKYIQLEAALKNLPSGQYWRVVWWEGM